MKPVTYGVTKEGRRWYVTENGKRARDDSGYKTKHEAEAEAEQSRLDHEAELAAKTAPADEQSDEQKAADEATAALADADHTPNLIGAMDPVERLKLAKAERDALVAWRSTKQDGPKPGTPILDWMLDATNATPKAKAAASKAAPARTPEQDAALYDLIKVGRENGDSWAKIATAINEAGIPSNRGGDWWDTTVSDYAKRVGLTTVAA